MNENKTENVNSEITEVEDLVIEEGDTIETIKQKTEDHNQKVKEYREQVNGKNKQLYERTKKAEGFSPDGKGGWIKTETKPKEEGDGKTTSPKDGLSSQDVITIVKNNVPEEDIDEIVEYAKFKKISLSDALKDNVVKTILADNAEKRKVADGANTDGGKRGSGRLSDEALLSNASKGVLPSSAEDMTRLTKLKLRQR